MKEKAVYLILVFFILLHSSFASGSEFLLKEKDVRIDADWKIRVAYKYKVFLDKKEDVSVFSEIIIPEDNPVRKVKEIYGYWTRDGRKWAAEYFDNSVAFPNLQIGTTIEYGYTVETRFQGFESFFTDQFKANDAFKVRKSRYAVSFPGETKFLWAVTDGKGALKQGVKYENRKYLSWEFTGVGISTEADILKVSTVASWDEIKSHYLRLYSDVADESINIEVLELSKNEENSVEEKVQVVMDYLRDKFSYKTYMSASHNLVPDHPGKVFKRGWGDCKDMVLLAVSILKKSGVDAFVVLTGPRENPAPVFDIPNPYVLDHAILGIQSGDKREYYDYLKPGYETDIKGKILIALKKNDNG